MRRFWFGGIFMALIFVLLIGCSNDADGENNKAEEKDDEVTEEEVEQEEDQEEADEVDVDEEVEEEEDPGFASEIRVLDIETVLNDQEEVSDFSPEEETFIEHEELLYVEADFITEVLDYELTYDEENTFAEVFKDKGDFTYESTHEDEGGAIMDIGQMYIEDLDEYEDTTGEEELYRFIEYDGKLYVPKRLISVYMKSPLNYEQRDKTIELGLHSEATSIYDVGLGDDASYAAEMTQNASDVTIKGENYEGGILLNDITSADKNADINLDYQYSEIDGFVYNKSDQNTLEVKFMYDDDKTLDTIELKPGATKNFDYEVKGEPVLKIEASGAPGSSSEVVIVGEVK